MKRNDLWALDIALIGGMIALGAVILLIAAVQGAQAHSWYDYTCCSSRDCRPTNDVQEVRDGWIAEGSHVSRDRTKPSQDGQYHICRPQGGPVRCLYIPMAM